ncbi:hypothetical protein BKA65DRAFT_486665 [Rhexocercosporidium sp. MPI-PUGE-AT-0058]|nr:hypothetical protein BKA65DRAFT_486665 [Rhexocercosporidium sp. MPI-PUGE-AT-0058]
MLSLYPRYTLPARLVCTTTWQHHICSSHPLPVPLPSSLSLILLHQYECRDARFLLHIALGLSWFLMPAVVPGKADWYAEFSCCTSLLGVDARSDACMHGCMHVCTVYIFLGEWEFRRSGRMKIICCDDCDCWRRLFDEADCFFGCSVSRKELLLLNERGWMTL